MPVPDEASAAWQGWTVIGVPAAVMLVLLWRRGVIDPRRMTCREVGGSPAWVWLLGAVVVMGAQVMGAGIGDAAAGAIGLGRGGVEYHGLMQLAALGFPAAVGLGVVGVLARGMAGRGRAAGLRARLSDVPVGAWCLLLAVPIVMLAGLAATAIHTGVTGAEPDRIAHEGLRQMITERENPWTWALIVGAVVLAPIVEELVFRVFLGAAVLAVARRAWVAVVLTAAVFALMHRAGAQPVPWHATAVLWVLGVALGVAYERTRRLGVPIMMHALFNAGNIVLALLMDPV